MSKTLGLSLVIGASLGKTFDKTFGAASKETQKLGAAIKETDRKIAAANEVVKYKNTLQKLREKQKKAGGSNKRLAAGITAVEKQYKRAKTEAKKYGLEIGSIVREQKRLEMSSGRLNTKLSQLERRRESFGKLKHKIGQTRSVGLSVFRAAGMGSIIGAGAITALTMANRKTAELAALAGSVGIDPGSLSAWGSLVGEAGFNTEHVVDLVEEMNNKFGELAGLGEMTAAEESMQILGLEFEKIRALSPEQQFMEIARAAQNMEDSQQAVSAVDMLMGGEANKIIGHLRKRGESVDELLAQYKRLSVVTDEGREGAGKFNIAFNKLLTSGGSALREVAGIVGTELSPVIERWATDLSAFFRDNRGAVVEFIASTEDFFRNLPGYLAATGKTIGKIVSAMDTVAGWIVGDDEETAEETARREQREQWAAKRTPWGAVGAMANRNVPLPESALPKQQATVTHNPTTNITVNAAPGMDERAVAAHVERKLVERDRRQAAQLRGSAYAMGY